jgi:predicted amidophosphoribosyltransferase
MPKIYSKTYCMYCGKPQRTCVIQFLCKDCGEKKDDRKHMGFFYDYHDGMLRDLTLQFG